MTDTPSVFRRGKVWWTKARLRDGTRQQISLRTDNKVEAERYALGLFVLYNRREWGLIEQILENPKLIPEICDKVYLGGYGPPPKKMLEPRVRRSVNVYAIRRADTHEIKIGISDKPLKRLADLQTAHGEPLELLRTWLGGRDVEAELHRRFASSWKRGEWFHETPEIMAWINEPELEEAAA